MALLRFTSHLRAQLPRPEFNLPGATVQEILQAAYREAPSLRGYLLDDQGQVRPHVAIFVDGAPLLDRQTLSDPVSPHTEIDIMQALSGG